MAADRLWLKKLGYAPLKKTKERSSNFWSSTDLVSMLSLYVLYNSIYIYIYYKEIMVWSEFTSLCALSFHTLKKQHWPSTTDPISPWPRIEQQTTRIDGPFSFIFLGVTSAYIYIYMYTYIQMIHLCTSCVYIYISILIQISLSIFPSYFCWSWHLGQVVEADVPDDEPGITKVGDKGTSFNTGI